MALKGPIVLVEDDENDMEAIRDAIGQIGVRNEVISFARAEEAFDYLLTTKDQPFFILCDIKLPFLDGLSFRKQIITNELLKKKSIPFLFFTGIVTSEIVNSAYELDVQGFCQKADSYQGLKEQLLAICIYWKTNLHPNSNFDAPANS